MQPRLLITTQTSSSEIQLQPSHSLRNVGLVIQFGLTIWTKTPKSFGNPFTCERISKVQIIYMEHGMIWMNRQFSRVLKKLNNLVCLWEIHISLRTQQYYSIDGFTTLTEHWCTELLGKLYGPETMVNRDHLFWQDQLSSAHKDMVRCGQETVLLLTLMCLFTCRWRCPWESQVWFSPVLIFQVSLEIQQMITSSRNTKQEYFTHFSEPMPTCQLCLTVNPGSDLKEFSKSSEMQSTRDTPKPITSIQPSSMQPKKVHPSSDLCGMNFLRMRALSVSTNNSCLATNSWSRPRFPNQLSNTLLTTLQSMFLSTCQLEQIGTTSGPANQSLERLQLWPCQLLTPKKQYSSVKAASFLFLTSNWAGCLF